MGIVSVDYVKGPGRRGSAQGSDWKRTGRLTFLVQTSDPRFGPDAARTAVDPVTGLAIPGVGSVYEVGTTGDPWHEKDLGRFAQNVGAEEEDADGKSWIVTVDYGPYDATAFPSNPVDWPLRVQWGQTSYERVVWADNAGNAIVNSAGSRFAEPVTVDDSRSTFSVKRNELASAWSPTLAETYRDTVNDALWNGFPAKTVKCSSITTGEIQYDSVNQVLYYEVTYVFDVNRDTWVKKILDMGFTDISTIDSTKRLTIRDAQGQPLTEPGLLNGSGHRLAVGGTPVFLSFDVYPYVNFTTAFGLDLPADAYGGW